MVIYSLFYCTNINNFIFKKKVITEINYYTHFFYGLDNNRFFFKEFRSLEIFLNIFHVLSYVFIN